MNSLPQKSFYNVNMKTNTQSNTINFALSRVLLFLYATSFHNNGDQNEPITDTGMYIIV